ncbi:T9SS type A sorting domain-containing protein [candidate division KSB1 bacterium]|nr:T9SS type A sorting domain-containing protein [candidate division KSB1 bacterium]
MNLVTLLAGSSLVVAVSYAQPEPDFVWMRSSGVPGLDVITCVCNAVDDNYVVAGYAQVDAGYDMTITRFSFGGDTLWHRMYHLGDQTEAAAIVQTAEGGFAIAGYVYDLANTITRVLLVRIDADGDTLWTRLIGNSGEDLAAALRGLPDGGFVIAGSRLSDAGDADAALVRTDSNGDTLWTRSYGDARNEAFVTVELVPDGGFILSGNAAFEQQNWNSLAVRTDSLGNEIWNRVYAAGNIYSFGAGGVPTADGGFLFPGTQYMAATSHFASYLMKTDANGGTLWTRLHSVSPLDEITFASASTADGGIVLTGTVGDLDSALIGAQVVHMDSAGNFLWYRLYGAGSGAQATAIMETAVHSYMITGVWDLGIGNNYDAVLVRTGPEGLRFRTPNAGAEFALDSSLDITWNGTVYGGEVAIELNHDYPSGAWETIAASTANDGLYEWTPTGAESDHARLRIGHLSNPALSDTTDGDFSLHTPRLRLVWPNGGELILTGLRLSVQFERVLVNSRLQLQLKREFPDGEWDQVATNIQADSTAFWITRWPEGGMCRLRLLSMTDSTIADTSDADFILRAPSIILAAPGGGEQLLAGAPFNILWSAPEHEGNVRITLNRDYPDGNWETIASNTANTGNYAWTPDLPASEHCRVRVATFYDALSRAESAADFSIVASGLADAEPVPTVFKLEPPFPNPFNQRASISFAVPIASVVELALFDLNGRHVAELAAQAFAPGIHRLQLDGSALASGLYFVRMSAGDFSAIQKLVLLK